MTTTNKKLADFQQVTIHGRITHLEVVDYQQEQFLAVAMAHTMSENTEARVRFNNSNGLLTAFNNGNLVVGQELTVSGSIKGIRSFYMKGDVLMPLKYPELQLRCNGYIFGSKPQVKSEVVQPEVLATLEEIPF